MDFVVKNTTKWGLLDLLCPHSCRGCGTLGAVLCERCKKHITVEHKTVCPYCYRILAKDTDVCPDCKTPFLGFWTVGWRKQTLAKLVSDLKYKSVRACSDMLAELLDYSIPKSGFKDANVAVVPLPTIGKHIRERGMDHTLLLAKKLAKRRGWQVEKLLQRATDTVQVGTNAAKRRQQAMSTYALARKIDPNKAYLLLDDVWTTGASMQAAAKIFQQAGAKKLYGAVIEIGQPRKTE